MTPTSQPSESSPDQTRSDQPPAEGIASHTDPGTMRSVLHSEVAATLGLLTDEHDFRAMRHYRTFAFADYATYRQAVENLLRTRDAQGTHTTLALFDPEEYAEFCADTAIDPDSASSRCQYTAELAATGPTIPYDGQPLSDLIPALVDEGVRQSTWEYACAFLAQLGTCTSCGEDIGRAALARASDLLSRILDTARPGQQHVVCSISAIPETLNSVLHADTDTDGTTQINEAAALEFTTVLAVGLATPSPGGLVMRTTAPNTADRIYGWRLRGGGLEPLTAGEVFDAYCTDIESGDLVSPESDVDYCVPPDLGPDGPRPGHHH